MVSDPLPDDSFCNDMVLDAAGNIFVAESFVGTIFRVDAANALTRFGGKASFVILVEHTLPEMEA